MSKPSREVLLQVLDLARWAPSGDNTQPWRFEVLSDERVAVHGHDTRDWCLYDFQGRASQMAHGALLETLRIAASKFGLAAAWTLRSGSSDTQPVYDVSLSEDPALLADPLHPYIESRTVQRRPMKTTRLGASQREALLAAPGAGFTLRLFESTAARWALAKLLWKNAGIRLTCPEAYEVHKQIIEWGARFSEDRIPEEAVGVDTLTARLMHWVMQDWRRVEFFNKYLFGTVAPRVQLDVVPAMACAAHVLLCSDREPEGVADYVKLGCAMQRLWLTAASAGLHLQPEMTPVIFRWYVRAGQSFTALANLHREAADLADGMERVLGLEPGRPPGFLCRVGVSDAPRARSVRLPLEKLML